jgi:NAD(P)H-hydrate epimerase
MGPVEPIVTPEEMAAIDAAAPEPTDELIERAGAAVARAALELLGGAYGRRVVVVVGKGNNGADGRAAARRLGRRGVRCLVVDAAGAPAALPGCDLVVDAAYGTGFRGTFDPPTLPDPPPPVLAVDIPSGVSGLTGEATGRPWAARRTVTFAARKPGLLLAEGAELAGEVTVADIGLDTSRARAHLVTAGDVAAWLPDRPRNTHKWRSAPGWWPVRRA